MKKLISPIVLLAFIQFPEKIQYTQDEFPSFSTSENVFIITIDGFRWQEVFKGVDSVLLSDTRHTPDTSTMKLYYWDSNINERRKRLLPFFWNVLSKRGQVFGNRLYDNKVNVANGFVKSYPGYSEIFTGIIDPAISSNHKINNPNINVLEYLNSKPKFRGSVAAFTSWDLFPFILNTGRNDIKLNSGYETTGEEEPSDIQQAINIVQDELSEERKSTRLDQLTFEAAKEYIKKKHPKIFYLGLGETDEAAHDGRYDLYLEKAHKADQMIAELWNMIQTDSKYKDKTTLIITTDHGRGAKSSKWTSHGSFIKGSSQTWIALMGPGISSDGELKSSGQFYEFQLAEIISGLAGESFGSVRRK